MKVSALAIFVTLLAVTIGGNAGPVSAEGSLVHLYELDNLEDAFGGPKLTADGGDFKGGRFVFQEEDGLRLKGGLADRKDYSICVIVEYDTLPNVWNKIIDFQSLTDDDGLYLHLTKGGSSLYFYNETVDGPTNVPTNVDAHIVFVVDEEAGESRGYVNGIHQWTFDSTDIESPADDLLIFFEDDEATEDEAEPGSADAIGIYDGSLTDSQVSRLAASHSCGEGPDDDDDEDDRKGRFLGGGVVGAFPQAAEAARANRERANAAGSAAAAAPASAPSASVRPPSTGDGGLLP